MTLGGGCATEIRSADSLRRHHRHAPAFVALRDPVHRRRGTRTGHHGMRMRDQMLNTNSAVPATCPPPPSVMITRKAGAPETGAKTSAAARAAVDSVMIQYTASASRG